jgi:hypothetical protein
MVWLTLISLAHGGAFHSFSCLESSEAGDPGLLVPLLATQTLLPA